MILLLLLSAFSITSARTTAFPRNRHLQMSGGKTTTEKICKGLLSNTPGFYEKFHMKCSSEEVDSAKKIYSYSLTTGCEVCHGGVCSVLSSTGKLMVTDEDEEYAGGMITHMNDCSHFPKKHFDGVEMCLVSDYDMENYEITIDFTVDGNFCTSSTEDSDSCMIIDCENLNPMFGNDMNLCSGSELDEMGPFAYFAYVRNAELEDLTVGKCAKKDGKKAKKKGKKGKKKGKKKDEGESNNPFALIVKVDVKPERREDFLEVIGADAVGSRQEPGNIRFDVLESYSAPNTFFFYEVYTDDNAFEYHQQQSYVVAWGAFVASGGLLSEPSVDFAGGTFMQD